MSLESDSPDNQIRFMHQKNGAKTVWFRILTSKFAYNLQKAFIQGIKTY